jgi:hypothetical protein
MNFSGSIGMDYGMCPRKLLIIELRSLMIYIFDKREK